jgi:transcriptional regulator with XRE-family HTH domain
MPAVLKIIFKIRHRYPFFSAPFSGNKERSGSWLCIFCSPQTGGKDKDMYFNQVEFGKRIKEERNRLQMTQEDLAQELNIGYVHMNGIENGRKGCSIDLLLEIAEVLDVSTDYLLTGRLSGGTNTAKNKLKEIAARLNEIVGQLDA